MKALVCRQYGTPDVLALEDVETPRAHGSSVVVAVEAAATNFADTLMIAGRYQLRPDPPFVPGLEFIGRVVETQADATRFEAGDRVIGAPPHGAFSERILVDQDRLYSVPENLPAALGAGFLVQFGTAAYGLIERAQLRPGEVVLVTGGGGNVGRAVIQIAKRLGAIVVAATGSDQTAELARAAGADTVVSYDADDWSRAAKDATQGGAHVVFETVGGAIFDAALKVTRAHARVLTVGFAGGTLPRIPAEYLMIKNLAVHGVGFGGIVTSDRVTAQNVVTKLLDLHAAAPFTQQPPARVVPLAHGPEHLSRIADRRADGPVVIAPSLQESSPS